MQIKSNLGFAIIELLVVVVILVILVAITGMASQHYIHLQYRTQAQQALKRDINYLEQYYLAHGRYDLGNGDWPSLAIDTVVGISGVVYNISFIPKVAPANAQSYKLVATPLISSIQASDGSICSDASGNFNWPTNDYCE